MRLDKRVQKSTILVILVLALLTTALLPPVIYAGKAPHLVAAAEDNPPPQDDNPELPVEGEPDENKPEGEDASRVDGSTPEEDPLVPQDPSTEEPSESETDPTESSEASATTTETTTPENSETGAETTITTPLGETTSPSTETNPLALGYPAILVNPDPADLPPDHPYLVIAFSAGDKGSFQGEMLGDILYIYALPTTPWAEILEALPQPRQLNDPSFVQSAPRPNFVTAESLAAGPYRQVAWEPTLPTGELAADFRQEVPFTAVWEQDLDRVFYRPEVRVNLETQDLDLARILGQNPLAAAPYLPLVAFDTQGKLISDPYLAAAGFSLPTDALSYQLAKRPGYRYTTLSADAQAPLYEPRVNAEGEAIRALRPFGLALTEDQAYSRAATVRYGLNLRALSNPLLYARVLDADAYLLTQEALAERENKRQGLIPEMAASPEAALRSLAQINDHDPALSGEHYLAALEAETDLALHYPEELATAFFAGLPEAATAAYREAIADYTDINSLAKANPEVADGFVNNENSLSNAPFAENGSLDAQVGFTDPARYYQADGSLVYPYLINLHLQQVASTKLTVRWLEPSETDLPEDSTATPLAADLPLADPFTEEEPLTEPNQDLVLPLSFETVSRNKILSEDNRILSPESDLSLQAGNLSCRAKGEPYQDQPVFRPEDLDFEADEPRGLYRLDLLPLEDQSLSLYDLFGDPDDPLNPHVAQAQLLRAQNLMQGQEDLPRLLLGGVSSGIVELPLIESGAMGEGASVAPAENQEDSQAGLTSEKPEADADADADADANADVPDEADTASPNQLSRLLYRFEISYDPIDGALVEFIRLAGGAEDSDRKTGEDSRDKLDLTPVIAYRDKEAPASPPADYVRIIFDANTNQGDQTDLSVENPAHLLLPVSADNPEELVAQSFIYDVRSDLSWLEATGQGLEIPHFVSQELISEEMPYDWALLPDPENAIAYLPDTEESDLLLPSAEDNRSLEEIRQDYAKLVFDLQEQQIVPDDGYVEKGDKRNRTTYKAGSGAGLRDYETYEQTSMGERTTLGSDQTLPQWTPNVAGVRAVSFYAQYNVLPPPTGLEMTRQKEILALVISGLALGLSFVLRRKTK